VGEDSPRLAWKFDLAATGTLFGLGATSKSSDRASYAERYFATDVSYFQSSHNVVAVIKVTLIRDRETGSGPQGDVEGQSTPTEPKPKQQN
jgi:hypothetical protein